MTSSSRTGTPFPLYLKRIGPSVINRFFALRSKITTQFYFNTFYYVLKILLPVFSTVYFFSLGFILLLGRDARQAGGGFHSIRIKISKSAPEIQIFINLNELSSQVGPKKKGNIQDQLVDTVKLRLICCSFIRLYNVLN
ncbi:MAG: hypothetical protein QG610_2162 [Euryarchaeota archaeon]|nr:hypothetical protein [Euryarchaeota archaeon]